MMVRFITFGDGNQGCYDAAERLGKQAFDSLLFDDIKVYHRNDLQEDFWSKHGKMIENSRRGYGYWIWKPFLVNQNIQEMKTGDVLLYADAGCEIGGEKTKILRELLGRDDIDMLNSLACKPERRWCKRGLVERMGIPFDSPLLDEIQYQGGAVIYFVNDKIKEFTQRWSDLCEKHENIDDSGRYQWCKEFKDHRHDQAVYSLLLKTSDIQFESVMTRGIHISRNKSKISCL
jgi:hypothetical protein